MGGKAATVSWAGRAGPTAPGHTASLSVSRSQDHTRSLGRRLRPPRPWRFWFFLIYDRMLRYKIAGRKILTKTRRTLSVPVPRLGTGKRFPANGSDAVSPWGTGESNGPRPATPYLTRPMIRRMTRQATRPGRFPGIREREQKEADFLQTQLKHLDIKEFFPEETSVNP